ncbi:MAG: nicotinate-nucleotide--dimethylbenzimidazole phosphoribosyltransferase [Sphaerochaetaceae bacterium]|jgi:nicotinate-nucleotide--dimethylbenzimidazole phosphoribosyltransferase|nr:nicotinate-nucleotide--dimethylbenzimidazole phosphoribosyltransferase [Sphaerochaetaceae bacterium]HHU88376.1 nicotinate-nucleotide--dimethylbenzimidazole phosphoribosyltransferase [Spirochaetales bacterium]
MLFDKVTPCTTTLEREAWQIWDAKAKPQLSLGRLEEVAVRLVAIRGELRPTLGEPALLLFAADHGIVAEGVSSSPQEITWQQCLNFAHGGGAIGLICRENGIELRVIDVGVNYDFDPSLKITDKKIGYGTANFARHKAMDREQLESALGAGKEEVLSLAKEGIKVVAFGEMGVGNTTSASALMASLTSVPIAECTGRGAGLSNEGLLHKQQVLNRALALHGKISDPLEALATYGGFEIAAIVGGMMAAAHHRMVILVDGFITTVAALIATTIEPAVRDYLIFCHQSKESGHANLLKLLKAQPLLDLSMHLGEGSGAAVAWPIIRQALNLYLDMTPFSDAKVTDSVALLKKQGVDRHAER